MICSCCLSSPTKHPSCGRTWRIDQPPSCQFDKGSTREKKWSVWKIRTDIHCISGWWLVGMIWKNKKCSKPPTRYYLYIYIQLTDPKLLTHRSQNWQISRNWWFRCEHWFGDVATGILAICDRIPTTVVIQSGNGKSLLIAKFPQLYHSKWGQETSEQVQWIDSLQFSAWSSAK